MRNGSTYHQALCDVAEHAALKNLSVYLVGGIVRDLVRGVQPGDGDIDVMVVGDGIAFAHSLAQQIGGKVKEFSTFLTAKILAPRAWIDIAELDIASARAEIYDRPGALPRVQPGTLEDDLSRRDFTINAMAVTVPDILSAGVFTSGTSLHDVRLHDPMRGTHDLKERLVRVLHPRSFIDDPTRLFRAARYAARIGGNLESATARLAGEAVSSGAIQTISLVRVMNELVKLSSEPDSYRAMQSIAEIGVWEHGGLPFDVTVDEVVNAHTRLSRAVVQKPEIVSTTFIRALWTRWVPEPEREKFLAALQISKKLRAEILQFVSTDAALCPVSSMSSSEILWRAVTHGPSASEAMQEAAVRGIVLHDD